MTDFADTATPKDAWSEYVDALRTAGQAGAELARAYGRFVVAVLTVVLASPSVIREHWRAAVAVYAVVCAVVYVAPAAASPPPPVPAPALSWPTRTVERAAVKWLYATNPDEWGDGVRLQDAVASCSRTGRRYRCEVVSLFSIASGDEYEEHRDVLTRCTPDRRVHRNAASARAARIVVRQGGTPGKRGGIRCRRATS